MLRLLSISLLLLSGVYAHSQTISMAGGTQSVPAGGYPTCTATINGVDNKTVTWTTTGGTIVGINPSTQVMPYTGPSTVALFSASAGGPYTLTATSNANGSVSGHCTFTFIADPTASTVHPRFGGVTPSMIAALQAKAVSGNPMYQNSLLAVATSVFSTDNTLWNWSCGGGPGNTKTGLPTSDQTQSGFMHNMYLYAFMQMINPYPTAQTTYNWGCYSRDMWTYEALYWLNPLNLGYDPSTLPYRQTDANQGIVDNTGADFAEDLTMTPDWLMQTSAPSLVDGTGSTMTATLSGSTMNLPTVTAGGTGYRPNSTVWWVAPVGSSGCANIGYYQNGFSYFADPLGRNNGIPTAAMGVAQTDGSGVVIGPVTTFVNATGCTTAPSITVKSDVQITRDYAAVVGQEAVINVLNGVATPVGNYNSSAQFNKGGTYDYGGVRAMGNNYTHARELFLAMAGLLFNNNPTDDPPLTNSCSATPGVVCPDGTAYNRHAYFDPYLTGGMLYVDWANTEDPNVSWQAYQAAYGNLPTQPVCNDSVSPTSSLAVVPCFGSGNDGESTEGNWYQYSMYRTALMWATFQSAGVLNPTAYGPQMSQAFSSWWDLKFNQDISILTYSYITGQTRFAYLGTGDLLSGDRDPVDFNPAAWMMVYDSDAGRTDRANKLLWTTLYSTVGGLTSFYANLQNGLGYVNRVPLFIALPSGDPTATPPADPRPSLPLDTYSFNNGHILTHSAWTNDDGPISPSYGGSAVTQQVFNAYIPNTRINHEYQIAGSFDVLSNAEYITKHRWTGNNYEAFFNTPELGNMTSYGLTPVFPCDFFGHCFESQAVFGLTSWYQQNYLQGATVSLNGGATLYNCTNVGGCAFSQTPGGSPNWTTTTTVKGGGQMWQGYQGGNVYANHTEVPDHVAFDVDLTNVYNASAATALGWQGLRGVTGASRSLLYLRNSKQVFVVDRGAGATYTRNWLNTTGAITFPSTCVAKWTTRSGGQDAYYSMLLPTTGVTCSDAGAFWTNENQPQQCGGPCGLEAADWEPYSHLEEDAGSPSSSVFFNVLEWGSHGFTKSATTLVQSSAGQGYDCAALPGKLACFAHVWPATFTGTTVAAQSGSTAYYFSDLTPETTYTVTATGGPSSCTTDNAGVCTFTATVTSPNVVLGAGSPPPPAAPTNLKGVVVQGVQVQ